MCCSDVLCSAVPAPSLVARFRVFATLLVCTPVLAMISKADGSAYIARDLYVLSGPTSSNPPHLPTGIGHYAAAGQVVGEADGYVSNGGNLAMIWNASSPTNVNPFEFGGTVVLGTNGFQQVGSGGYIDGHTHALLWNGTSDSAVNLTPGLVYSLAQAYDTDGTHQVGYGDVGAYAHALLWSGTADSVADLHPANLSYLVYSRAWGVGGGQEVGDGESRISYQNHALLWNGRSNIATDLNPVGIDASAAYGTNGMQQVGDGSGTRTLGETHALVWNGTAGSAVDLNPAGMHYSIAYGTDGVHQVGWATLSTESYGSARAFIWSGTAGSAVDLHALLSSDFATSSATSIDGSGDIFGIATDVNSNIHAIEWTPMPEPGVPLLLGVAVMGLLRRQTRG